MEYRWNFGFLWDNAGFILTGLGNTFMLAGLCMALGLLAGSVLTLMRIGRLMPLRLLAAGFVGLFRNTPPLVQLLWLYYALPMLTGAQLTSFMAALVAFSLYLAAYLSEIFRSGIAGVDRGQWEAASAIGMRWWGQLRYIIVPQMLPRMLPALVSQSIDAVKLTSIAALLPYMEFVYNVKIVADQNYRPLEAYSALAIGFALILIPLVLAAGWLERRVAGGPAGR